MFMNDGEFKIWAKNFQNTTEESLKFNGKFDC